MMSAAVTVGIIPLEERHTPGHQGCPVCARAQAVYENQLTPQLTFSEAFELWLAARLIERGNGATSARFIAPRTERDLRQYARAAAQFFGRLRLEEIHAGHLRAYQRARAVCDPSAGGWERPAGANLIRKEIQTVVRVLRAAGAWTAHLEEAFEPVQAAPSDIPRALSPAEQHRWLHMAASRPGWRVVYWYSIVALQTTLSTNELRSLRRGDIFLEQGVLQVRSAAAKNRFRIRTVPLETPQLSWALGSLLERGARLGAHGPHQYLFPFHLTAERYDPDRPMSVWGLRKRWEEVRSAADLLWLRPYDLRHTAITRMAEAGVPIQVIQSLAGHISPRMQQHYTAISMEAKRRWAQAAWLGAESAAPQLEGARGRWVWQPAEQLAPV